MNSNNLHERFQVTTDNGYLILGVRDKSGNIYRDGSIVRVGDKIGVVRYSFGRFEIVCTFQDQRFIYGLNHDHEIIDHVSHDGATEALEQQASRKYASNG